MNKTKIFIVAAGLFTMVNSGCKNDLNINPSDQYSEKTFWKTQADAMAGLTGIYNELYECINWHYETDMITANGLAYNESNGTDAIAKGAHTPITALVVNRWTQGYRGVGRANTFISKIDGIAGMAEPLKNRTIGEAKFLRAFYYLGLVDCFGGVPLMLDPPDLVTQAKLPRNTADEVYNQIIKDLNEAILVLPDTYASAADLGRVTKGAAMALKSRVLLYTNRWPEAAAASKALMDMNIYTLFPNYRNMFLLANEHNSEVIFNVEYLAPRFLHNLDNSSYLLNRPAPTRNLANVYLMKDGKTKEESPLYNSEKPFDNRDPRLLQTMYPVGYKFNGRITAPANVVTTGFGLKKYTNFTDDDAQPAPKPGNGDINVIFIRYAEILLTYAEAQNEINGADATVYEALNKLRKRASVNMPDIMPGLNKDQMREVIRRERRVELAFEGMYYSDIKRWKIAEVENKEPILNYLNQAIANRSFNKDRNYLWPIPSNQIQLNTNLKQNPNWF